MDTYKSFDNIYEYYLKLYEKARADADSVVRKIEECTKALEYLMQTKPEPGDETARVQRQREMIKSSYEKYKKEKNDLVNEINRNIASPLVQLHEECEAKVNADKEAFMKLQKALNCGKVKLNDKLFGEKSIADAIEETLKTIERRESFSQRIEVLYQYVVNLLSYLGFSAEGSGSGVNPETRGEKGYQQEDNDSVQQEYENYFSPNTQTAGKSVSYGNSFQKGEAPLDDGEDEMSQNQDGPVYVKRR